MIKIYKRKPDCINYDACLTQAAVADAPLKCSGCHRYRPGPLDVECSLFDNHEDVTIHLADPEVCFPELEGLTFSTLEMYIKNEMPEM